MSEEVFAALKNIPFLHSVPETLLLPLAQNATRRTFPKNAMILCEGDEGHSLYVLLSGKVRVFLGDEKGNLIILQDMDPGGFFGELSILDGGGRSASVTALQPTVCGIISRQEFLRWLHDSPEAAFSVILGLTGMVRRLTGNVRSLGLLDVYGRLAALIQEMAEPVEGVPTIARFPSHQELANRVGSCREMVTRIMRTLVKGGYVETEGRILRVRKKLPKAW
jgi:CRP/FNR family cyclic AMP-dependent transcriptional regulator